MSSCKYINRDLSWLAFNRRVLEEARNENTPLLEQAKFLAIVSTNMDEFLGVRAAGIKRQIIMGVTEKDFTGYTPQGLWNRILRRSRQLSADQYETFRQIAERLASNGIDFVPYNQLSSNQKQELDSYFHEKVLPLLKPKVMEDNEAFPLVSSKALYFSIVLRTAEDSVHERFSLALLELPPKAGRFVELVQEKKRGHLFILLEHVIKAHIPDLFQDRIVVDVSLFRVIRDADLPLDEESADDLLLEVEQKLQRRMRGAPVRLETEKHIHPYALERLKQQFDVGNNVIHVNGPVDLSFLMKLSSVLNGYEHLRYPDYNPLYPQEFEHQDFFAVLRERDVAVFHPYESFDAFDDFLEQAADDSSVTAIKMTIYRVSKKSRIVQALVRAAGNGKQVTVVVELKARFDEARNIAWAKKLEKAGCHVILGWIGLKIHAKMTIIERTESTGIKRYAHVSTGNYNGQTAKSYTDIGMFTSHLQIANDIANLFDEIAAYEPHHKSQVLAVSPTDLRLNVYAMLQREIRNAAVERPARIIAKMNSLSDKKMIDRLYEASGAGVKIDLIVRGICCLCPGVPGQSENITVRSIIDRYLEHSRVFYFENDGNPQVWLSSADWMTRNLSNRIELMCPVLHPTIKQTIIQLLQLQLADNTKARQLLPGGTYKIIHNELPVIRSQVHALPVVYRKYSAASSTLNNDLNPGFR